MFFISKLGCLEVFQVLIGLKGETLLTGKRPESLVAHVLDLPLRTQVVGQLGEQPEVSPWSIGRPSAIFVRGQFSVPAFGHQKSPPLGVSFQFEPA